MSGCTCGHLSVGMEVTESRNWNAKCSEHGTESEWWKTTGKARRDEQNQRSIDLQGQAAEARRNHRAQETE